MLATDFHTDYRWRGEWAPEGSLAAYGARWISLGGGTTGDILPDRQGFGYDHPLYRDALINALKALHLHAPTPFWHDTEPADVTDRAMMTIYESGSAPDYGLYVQGYSAAWNTEFRMECRDGYIYVEAWLLSDADGMAKA